MAKILIIDDDPDIVGAMKVVLEAKGYKVDSAPNGALGLAKSKKDKPDLVILDVMMETASTGFDVAREMRKYEETKLIPIVMLTAIKHETGMDFKAEAGDEAWLPVDEYCDKPIKMNDLIQKVADLLNKR